MIELTYLVRLGLSVILSFFIGWEREEQDKNAGLRTLMLISLGSTIFTLLPFLLLPLSKQLDFSYDFSRIIAYVVAGVGFLAGIVIVGDKRKVRGITTSACIWSIVGVGILCGMGQYTLAIISAFFIYAILKLKYIKITIAKRRKRCRRKRNQR